MINLWSTHIPVLKAFLHLDINFVLELGTGNFSTKTLSSAREFIAVENDKDWYEKIIKLFPQKNILYHSLGNGINKTTKLSKLNKEQIDVFKKYYINFLKPRIPTIGTKMMFVDHFRCVRSVSIECLYDNFEIIVYHDSENPKYKYERIEKILTENFNGFSYETYPSKTCFWIKKNTNIEGMIVEKIKQETSLYNKDSGVSDSDFPVLIKRK